MRFGSVFVLSPLLLVIGCQSASNLPGGTGVSSAAPAGYDSTTASVPTAPGIDDDSDFDPPNPITKAMFSPFRAVGRSVDGMFAGPIEFMQKTSGDTPRKAALQLEDKSSADNRRNGLNRLLEFSFTHRPPYTKVYEGMATLDEDSTVRSAALRACNRSRDDKATSVFIKGLSDPSEWVRLEAAKGLANLPDPQAAVPLAGVANNTDENRDVRIAAADALKYYRTLAVARVLSSMLADRDFSISWQARRSLVYLTHADFGYEQAAWLGYFAGPGKPLG
jgi:hypothetical protein